MAPTPRTSPTSGKRSFQPAARFGDDRADRVGSGEQLARRHLVEHRVGGGQGHRVAAEGAAQAADARARPSPRRGR